MGLTTLDYLVLAAYFVAMALIGLWSMLSVKKQEDYFLGSRSFGKMFQMFAAFGAGTNASDPIVTAKTTFTNGLSGVWSGLLWLFVTPFYWICGVWYRRMRCLTLGDWFEERYQSKAIAFAYMIFGAVFYMVYLGVGMTAIGKMGAPLVGADTLSLFGWTVGFDQFIIVLTAACVLFYGVLGGLRAAYWTDLIQGIFIVILSIILIPVGLNALVKDENETLRANAAVATATDATAKVATDAASPAQTVANAEVDAASSAQTPANAEVDAASPAQTVANAEVDAASPAQTVANAEVDAASPANVATPAPRELSGTLDGFEALHRRVPAEYFEILTSPKGGEFPLHYILAITLLNLLGIVCQPHFIATGGGSAKTEYNARFGLVAGNILKRFCTIGWAFTALVALAYLASNVELASDPDKVWGVATRELLGPLNCGLVGLMLACLLAALMSSASCYMLVVSALVVRNGYAAYVNPNASEKTFVFAGRLCGAVVIIGATVVSLTSMNVFEQLKFAWEIPIVFAAPFWIGLYWRRANKWSAWGTIALTLTLFFLIPMNVAKFKPSLTTNPQYLATNEFVVVRETRAVSPTDVERRDAAIQVWNERREKLENSLPQELSDAERAAAVHAELGPAPKKIALGETIVDEFRTGGKAIFWGGGVAAFDESGAELVVDSKGRVVAKIVDGKKTYVATDAPTLELFDPNFAETEDLGDSRVRSTDRFKSVDDLASLGVSLKGRGSFELDFLLYERCGFDLVSASNGTLEAMRLPTRLFLPFVFLILLSFVTPRGDKELLDRYFVKMKTPVDPDPERDAEEMRLSYENPNRFDDKRLFKFGGLEFNRPTVCDVVGFVVSFAICVGFVFVIVALAAYRPR